MDFKTLVEQLHFAHETAQKRAGNAVNLSHTIRNWLFGYYIVEFEQNGRDYSLYGSQLLYKLADALKKKGIKGVSYTNLTLFRKFYLIYPQIGGEASTFLGLNEVENSFMQNLQPMAEDSTKWMLPPKKLLENLGFSHFVHLIPVEDKVQRLFYEIECIKGKWTRRQLQRQIGSLLYERTGLSKNKEALLGEIESGKSTLALEDIIRDPYIFEFSGLKSQEVFRESDLEKALLDHLQEFLLELGTGFCFEARQKSYLIDNERYKVDLLFYHRILKCHIMIDLKTGKFSHQDAGQMNFYLNYHKDNEMQENDNLPLGIILCTDKNETVVKYATGSVDNQIMVSKYMLQLPDENTLLRFIEKEKKILGFPTASPEKEPSIKKRAK
jgi:predicted nuclease of restriction endonuclease-like (RecB) superfamily